MKNYLKVISIPILLFSLNAPIIYAQDKQTMNKPMEVKLKNGLTAVIKEDLSHPIVSVQVWVKTGSINESQNTAGLSHFLEHLIFKGSKKFPGDAISRIVEAKGGYLNAATSKEFTEYYITLPNKEFTTAVEILADAMENAAFPGNEIEKERNVILQEMKLHEDNPQSLLYDLYCEKIFINTPYAHRVLGTKKVIQDVSKEEITKYYHTHYAPENLTLVIVGAVKTDEAKTAIEKYFGTIKKRSFSNEKLENVKVKQQDKTIQKDVEHTYWIGGFLGPNASSKEQFSAEVAASILGGMRSSRLYRKLREEDKTVYAIETSYWAQISNGAFVLWAILEPQNKEKVISEIKNQISLLMNNGPTNNELAKAKEMITTEHALAHEKFSDQADLIGYLYTINNPWIIDSYISGINDVTKDDITNLLKKYYLNKNFTSVAIVPKQNEK
ncbi:MAG: insulinase family protein [Endomicrobiales bacterium]|nr:insulinase family protein [Endomicrobiales bacterium]